MHLHSERLVHDWSCLTKLITRLQEFLVVFRHLLSSQHRRAILPKIDQLLDERVLLGTSLASREMFRCEFELSIART
jgi:transformation/transcription domain-associated protein